MKLFSSPSSPSGRFRRMSTACDRRSRPLLSHGALLLPDDPGRDPDRDRDFQHLQRQQPHGSDHGGNLGRGVVARGCRGTEGCNCGLTHLFSSELGLMSVLAKWKRPAGLGEIEPLSPIGDDLSVSVKAESCQMDDLDRTGWGKRTTYSYDGV
ncbi:hypothetical protein SAY86_028075 [Trapa natans]|uniref:Uncharacterized protein n=1 Tax=Trapa natans TaxID=22666 RepID=A0AAN7M1P6_TRANT|nr:hypothetical protein SAY86_028075 [Trapa natans]